MENIHQIRLEIPSAAEYVSVVRQAVEGIAKRMHFDAMEVGDLKLAVGEACNNAIRHGCTSTAHPCVTVICYVASSCLEIEVFNGLTGKEPCPTIVEAVNPEKEGGMGLFIIRKVMDEVEINWEDCSARVRMVKRMKPICADA